MKYARRKAKDSAMMFSAIPGARAFLSMLVCAMALGSVGCSKKHHHEEALPNFPVTNPMRRDTDVVEEFVCQIRAIQHIELRSLESGYLRDIYVDEGETVRAGQRLFQVTPVVFQAEVDRSDAEARAAAVEFNNTRALREGNVVSENELTISQAHLQRANAQRALANAHLKFTTISAPFAGIVGRFRARRGSLLEEGAELTELSDNSRMWVYFNVSEAQYLTYRAEHQANDVVHVKLRMANGEIFDQTGVIETIEADFNNSTGTIAFRAGFANPNALLRHGETGKILLTEHLPGALLIPQKAVFRVLDKAFVFVVNAQGVVHSRELVLGDEAIPHLFVVREGLTENDRILVDGIRRVRDGDRIAPAVHSAEEIFAGLDVPAE